MAGFPVSRTQRVFEDFLEAYPDYWAMFVFDRTGKVLAGGNAKGTDLTGADRAGRNYVQAIVEGADTFVTPTVLKSKSGGGIHILGAAAAVKDTSGSNMGGVAVFPKWDIFTERFIDPITIGETGYAFVFNSKGRLMAHSRDRDLVLEDLGDLGFVREALEKKDGFVDYLWEGREKIMGVTREERTG
ncbi:PDC sensor domain-containing protein [Desulfohalovibrio reitneri]|uniref:PDC sensor domain-containing protein n=1 Tax=Desulfohalovibrio reitneri TaxID=1307759 RepID=UPI0006901741|nr:cache domain-containing protein [Desulfohalovibrio reitneri]